MIYNQWYIILESKEIGQNKLIKFKRLNENLTLWRDKTGKVNCITDRCCHRGASLADGKIVDNNIECPFHGFQFGGDGKVKIIPANGKNTPIPESQHVKAYYTYENYGFIWIWWGDENKKISEPFFFKELAEMTYSTFVDHWNCHYSRSIENQLDVVHLPFVHRTTIGAGNKTLVNGPVVVWNKDLMTFYVNNILDDGNTIPLKTDEIPDFEKLFHLQFHFPNIWQNIISDKIRIFAAFVPVDEENTIIYLRNYQKFITIPVIRDITNYFLKISNIIILRQDKKIVIKQLPKKSTLKMDERLIMGDKPIIEYRKHRNELIESK